MEQQAERMFWDPLIKNKIHKGMDIQLIFWANMRNQYEKVE